MCPFGPDLTTITTDMATTLTGMAPATTASSQCVTTKGDKCAFPFNDGE